MLIINNGELFFTLIPLYAIVSNAFGNLSLLMIVLIKTRHDLTNRHK